MKKEIDKKLFLSYKKKEKVPYKALKRPIKVLISTLTRCK